MLIKIEMNVSSSSQKGREVPFTTTGSFSFSCLLTLDLDNLHFIQVNFVAEGGFLLIIHIGFRKFWWISWISIFRPTGVLIPASPTTTIRTRSKLEPTILALSELLAIKLIIYHESLLLLYRIVYIQRVYFRSLCFRYKHNVMRITYINNNIHSGRKPKQGSACHHRCHCPTAHWQLPTSNSEIEQEAKLSLG